MSKRTPLLILGLGNVLLTDDGVGPAAVARLQQQFLPPDGALRALPAPRPRGRLRPPCLSTASP